MCCVLHNDFDRLIFLLAPNVVRLTGMHKSQPFRAVGLSLGLHPLKESQGKVSF